MAQDRCGMQMAASEGGPGPNRLLALIRIAANDLQTKRWGIFVLDASQVREPLKVQNRD